MLFSVPALLKIILTFALILGLSRFLPLYLCLLAGCLVIGLWMGLGPWDVIVAVCRESTSGQTLWLAAVIILILVLSSLLQKSGQLDRIVRSFQRVSPDPRFSMAAMPALIGLLPMPGGALFSAPMVEASASSDNVTPELKVAINYWFRHIWEYWWPLYPGIILAVSLFGVQSWKLIAAQVPLTLGVLAAGILFILSRVDSPATDPAADRRGELRPFLRETAPISVVVICFLGLQAIVDLVGLVSHNPVPSPKYLSLFVGLVLAMAIVVRRNSMGWPAVKEATFDPGILTMVMLIFAIMSFQAVLIESKVIDQVRSDLARYRIPPLLIMAVLPFVAGMVTGIAIGFVGAAFPLVVALLPDGQSVIPFAVLAFGCGYMGMMLSPVHLCFVVTREFFHADFLSSYTFLWKPALFGFFWTVALFMVYRVIL